MDDMMMCFGVLPAPVLVLQHDTNGIEELEMLMVISVQLIMWEHPCWTLLL
jgi:hypothetical protein